MPIQIPILVTSLEPGGRFSEVCETLVVNAHGCSMRSPAKLDAGVIVQFHSKDGRETTAKVVYCQPFDSDRQDWRLGARLEQPDNFWGLKTCPQDWAPFPVPVEGNGKMRPAAVPAKGFRTIHHAPEKIQPTEKIPGSLKTMLDNLQKQVADDRLRAMMAEVVRPLVAEIAELRAKVARAEEPKERSKFEVSLSHIPHELQDQIEQRLRKELGPRVLDEARSQSAQLLKDAKGAIERKTTESHEGFRQKVSEDLRAVEKRVQNVSAEVVETLRDHVRRQMGEFHQHVVDTGNRLKVLSEELLVQQQNMLGDEHDGRRQELEQVRAAVASESSRLRAEVEDLSSRIARLDESARGLESGLDIRLSKMASNTVSSARTQLESTVDLILEELGTRSTQEIEHQVEEADVKLVVIQKRIENAASETMRVQAAGTLEAFERNLDELARKSVERCRGALASGLESLVRSLGNQFRLEPSDHEGKYPRAE